MLIGCCTSPEYSIRTVDRKDFADTQSIRYTCEQTGAQKTLIIDSIICSFGEPYDVGGNTDCLELVDEICGQTYMEDDSELSDLDYSVRIAVTEPIGIYYNNSFFKTAYDSEIIDVIISDINYEDTFHLFAIDHKGDHYVNEIYYERPIGVVKLIFSDGEIWNIDQ